MADNLEESLVSRRIEYQSYYFRLLPLQLLELDLQSNLTS